MVTSEKRIHDHRQNSVLHLNSGRNPMAGLWKFMTLSEAKHAFFWTSMFLFQVIICCGANVQESNADDLSIKTMRIEHLTEGRTHASLTTTGACFILQKDKGIIQVYQRIGGKRKIAEVHLSKDFLEIVKRAPRDRGFEYVWSCGGKNNPEIIISGDSLIRFNNIDNIKIVSPFTPVYRKLNRSNNGLMLLDNRGGMVINPPENISLGDYPITVNGSEWKLDSRLKMSTLFLGVCPPREFDWERSKWPVVHYSSHIKRYPSNEEIIQYSQFAKVLELHQWIWKRRYENKKDCMDELFGKKYNDCSGDTPLWRDHASDPINNRWIPEDEKELRRVIQCAHSRGMLVAVYFNGLKMDSETILPEAGRLKKKYDLDGIYLDGLLNNTSRGPLDAYLAARELRMLFGDRGWINFHNTNNGYYSPHIHAYMDFITTGEHHGFDKWKSSTFNISNAIGGHWPEIPYFWPDPQMNIKDARPFLRDLADISLRYNNRILFLAGEGGQWRFWRLYFTPAETEFMKEYYLGRLGKRIQ